MTPHPFLSALALLGLGAGSAQAFTLHVLHINDFHSRIESISAFDSTCSAVYKGDYFKLRSVAATIPMAFAFPESVQNSTLTISLNNSYLWTKEIPWMDPEGGNNDGASAIAPGLTERTPAPITLRIGLQVTF